MTGQALIVQGDALHLPLPDASVDLVVTSPPYWALRAYSAGPGEIGSEPTPQEYLEALWAATAEMMRVLKPSGSMFVDLGDKYAAKFGPNSNAGKTNWSAPGSRYDGSQRSETRSTIGHGAREKSLMLLPERYRVGCVDTTSDYYRAQFYQQLADDLIDGETTPERARELAAEFEASPKSKGLGLIARAVIIWNKPNGLPESVTDRVRRSHEDWVHLVKQPRYYSATDAVRTAHAAKTLTHRGGGQAWGQDGNPDNNWASNGQVREVNPLGALPGSVWTIASEPLSLPGYFVLEDGQLRDFLPPGRGGPRPRRNGNGHGLFDPDAYSELVAAGDGSAWRWLRATGINASPWPQDDRALQLRTAASHYAAFPSRWPEQLIKGFSPPGICLDCDQGRGPVVEQRKLSEEAERLLATRTSNNRYSDGARGGGDSRIRREELLSGTERARLSEPATILGYACSCTPYTDHPGTGEGTGPSYAESIATVGYPDTGTNDNGRGATSLQNRPKVGPWREYHLGGWKPPPTRPAVILDPFSGVGTTIGVARQLGRIGIGVDLSHPYCRAAKWRVFDSGSFSKAQARTWADRQGVLL